MLQGLISEVHGVEWREGAGQMTGGKDRQVGVARSEMTRELGHWRTQSTLND